MLLSVGLPLFHSLFRFSSLLQVENILQSSATSFKLCDFGSVATASPPPSSMQEMRAVEMDINTHTTMQYRAPEMVDVYQRRVIDEKSGPSLVSSHVKEDNKG